MDAQKEREALKSVITSRKKQEEMNQEKPLKPCPFCGSENLDSDHMIWSYTEGYVVFCNECGCMTGCCATKLHAVEAWNRRAESVKE